MNTAFVAPVFFTNFQSSSVSISKNVLIPQLLSCRRVSTTTTTTTTRMTSDDGLTPAERTRRLLADSESRVKFRRQTIDPDVDDSAFKYTSGTTKGGFDVWLIAAILTVLVPAIGFAVGVATGFIDINPR